MKHMMLVFNCKSGMILAEDIIHNGAKLASRNTVLNSYIIDKLIGLGELKVSVYVTEDIDNLDKNNHSILKKFKHEYGVNIHLMKRVLNELITETKVNVDDVLQISNFIVNYLDEPNTLIECLNSLKEADEYTYTHCLNVAIYSMLIAKWMNLSFESIIDVIQAALLHDIGKIKISNEILNKPSRLTKEEFDEIKKHSILGYAIANKHHGFNENIKEGILMHHERIDGSGYPFGKKGMDIALSAKIVAVADTFDAMTSSRVYKKGVTPFKAFLMFITEGINQYDISVIFALLENISAYYIGMKVEFEDGRIGEIVYIPPNDVLSPIVKIDDELIDLSRESGFNIINIFN
ncbi:HD-GYP domain-containing protein [Clostridium chromiireducens]|uniref:HD-GYP domain-containing protein n=1 Tax=Clostridium chromiireducens TaxID=225345 RepID=UPI003AF57C22